MQHLTAQKTIYIRPDLGLESPLSKVKSNGYKPFVTLKNNARLYLTLKYELAVEFVYNSEFTFSVGLTNGKAGYAMGVIHTKPCVEGGPAPIVRGSDAFRSGVYNNRRFLFTVRYYPKKWLSKKLNPSFESGIGFDLKSIESDTSGRFKFPGPNQCNEIFDLEDQPAAGRKPGLIIPLQFNIEPFGKQKLMVSVFFHQGIFTQFVRQIDYVTDTYRDKSFFKIKGTSYGFKLSYPIRVSKKKAPG